MKFNCGSRCELTKEREEKDVGKQQYEGPEIVRLPAAAQFPH